VPPLSLHVKRRGHGSPTVWIHGWSAEIGVWQTFPDIPGRSALLIDLPGHGRSPWETDWTLSSLARDVLALLDAPADFVGWSLGGVLSVACALERPDLVKSIAILAMSNFGGERSVRLRNSLANDKLRAMADFYRAVWSPQDRQKQWFGDMQRELARDRHLPSTEAMIGTYDGFHSGIPSLALEKVACPVVIVHGTEDGVAPMRRALEIAARMPRARVEPIEGAGHVPFLTFPEECRAILDRFWSNPGTAPS
jgi:pimeloyl-[acyl-carrier protein] methyl ester esterase